MASGVQLANPLPGGSGGRIPDGERVYAIGDVHGRLDLLERLISSIRQDNATRGKLNVRLVLLGELVDRGPNSAELVRRCMAIAARSDRFVVLRGKHESMMVDGITGNLMAFALWLREGGGPTLSSWGVPEELVQKGPSRELRRAAREQVPHEVLRWMDTLPPTCRIGGYLFDHSGVQPAEQMPEEFFQIHKESLKPEADHSFVVVPGHFAEDEDVVIRQKGNEIDPHAHKSTVLTALALEADRRWTLSTTDEAC